MDGLLLLVVHFVQIVVVVLLLFAHKVSEFFEFSDSLTFLVSPINLH